MKKLKHKTIGLLITILSIFLLILLFIFNISIYSNEYKALRNKIMRIETAHNKFKPEKNEPKNPMFMDTEAYVVYYDMDGFVKNIVSYTGDDSNIDGIANIVGNKGDYKVGEIQNLYFNKYITFLNRNDELIVINNSVIQRYLLSSLATSIGLFIALEIVIIYVSFLLAKWLTRPVIETFEKQKQFIYDASHELKTPISIIMASAEALETDRDKKKWIYNIKSESERMDKLVKNLLELSKSEDLEEKLVFENHDLSKLIENKALTFESLMFEVQLSLELNIEKNVKFKCDVDRIKELLSILIDNAIKHGYEKSKIVINLYKEKDDIYLEVKNRGDAIPKEDREKIFERFYRVDVSRNRDANRYGLGLAIAKNIVERHNGTISVDCKNGYTTFKVHFKEN